MEFVSTRILYFGNYHDSIFLDHSLYFQTPKKGDNLFFTKKELDNRTFIKYYSAKFRIQFDSTQVSRKIGGKNAYQAIPIMITNLEKDTVLLGQRLNVILLQEAINKNGEWKAIERKSSGGQCRISGDNYVLPPNGIILTSSYLYSGDFRTKIRFKLGENYSKVFEGKINLAQFGKQ